MSKHISTPGIVEYFEGLVKYMRKLGYEDPRDKRIEKLEARLAAVEALPDKWRNGSGCGDWADGVCNCADELNALLGDE